MKLFRVKLEAQIYDPEYYDFEQYIVANNPEEVERVFRNVYINELADRYDRKLTVEEVTFFRDTNGHEWNFELKERK